VGLSPHGALRVSCLTSVGCRGWRFRGPRGRDIAAAIAEQSCKPRARSGRLTRGIAPSAITGRAAMGGEFLLRKQDVMRISRGALILVTAATGLFAVTSAAAAMAAPESATRHTARVPALGAPGGVGAARTATLAQPSTPHASAGLSAISCTSAVFCLACSARTGSAAAVRQTAWCFSCYSGGTPFSPPGTALPGRQHIRSCQARHRTWPISPARPHPRASRSADTPKTSRTGLSRNCGTAPNGC
jgi:hypothetical protein